MITFKLLNSEMRKITRISRVCILCKKKLWQLHFLYSWLTLSFEVKLLIFNGGFYTLLTIFKVTNLKLSRCMLLEKKSVKTFYITHYFQLHIVTLHVFIILWTKITHQKFGLEGRTQLSVRDLSTILEHKDSISWNKNIELKYSCII